jgi:WD40 repeat protein
MCSLNFKKNGSGWVYECKFAPKGDVIVSGSYAKTLKIWDVESGTCQATLEGHRYLF